MTKVIAFYIILSLCTLAIAGSDPFVLPATQTRCMKNYHIYYAEAKKIAEQINNKNNALLSENGHAIADERTNQLWLEDDNTHLKKIMLFIRSIDIPLKRILIKSRIIFLDDNSMHELGFFLTSPAATDPVASNNAPNLFASLPLFKIGDQHLLDLKLNALEASGHANIISTPEILTNDRHTALIESGSELPYQEKSGEGNTSVAFKKAVLRLKVTPFILPANKLLLKLNVNQDKPSNLVINGTPSITTQQLETEITIDNQQTLILGGIREQMDTQNKNGIPLLDQIPVVGSLFTNQKKVHEHKQLLIFITPEILTK